MDKDQVEKGGNFCPVGKFFLDMEECLGKKSDFFAHINKSRIEFLKGMRSLLDEKINSLEKKGTSGKERKATRIKVD